MANRSSALGLRGKIFRVLIFASTEHPGKAVLFLRETRRNKYVSFSGHLVISYKTWILTKGFLWSLVISYKHNINEEFLGSVKALPNIGRILESTGAVTVRATPQKAISESKFITIRERVWLDVVVQSTQLPWDDPRELVPVDSDGFHVGKIREFTGNVSVERIFVDVQPTETCKKSDLGGERAIQGIGAKVQTSLQ